MNKKLGVSVFLGLVIILALIAGLVTGFSVLVKTVGIEGSVLWSTLVAALGWMISEHISRRREHEKLLAEQKRQMYFEFIDFLLSMIESTRRGKKNKHEDLANDLGRWSLRLTLVGSDGVVKAWNDFRMGANEADTSRVFRTMAQLMMEMRKDCGHYSTGLTKFEMLSAMIKPEDLKKLSDALEETNQDAKCSDFVTPGSVEPT